MKDLIKEVALEVWPKVSKSTSVDQSIAVEFATAFLAELSKRAAPLCKGYTVFNQVSAVSKDSDGDGTFPLFTFPPIHDIEAIENRVAEACAKAIRFADNGTEAAEILRQGEWRKHK